MYNTSESDSYGLGCGCIVAIVLAICVMVYVGAYKGSATQVRDTVTRVERVNYDRDSKYLIFGKKEVYEDTDSLLFGKFNSSDIYGKIDPGHTYRFTVVGWRIPFFSKYRNILKIHRIR